MRLNNVMAFLGIEFNSVNHLERIVAALGGFIGIWCVMNISHYFIAAPGAVFMVASMGASAVLLFAVPHGTLSQPWHLVGGHLISAFIGVTCFKLFSDTLLAGSLSVSLAIVAMHYLRCLHPPGGATALSAILGNEKVHALGYYYIITPVLINVGIILLVAILINNLFPWRRYPPSFTKEQLPQSSEESISHSDLEYALKKINSFIDISEHDLVKIYQLAIQHHAQATSLQPGQIELGRYYSNGLYNEQWNIRQVIDKIQGAIVTYKVIVGAHRRQIHTCSLEEFTKWANYEVVRNENSWQRLGLPTS